MQNAKKSPSYMLDYSLVLLNLQENEKTMKKYMIFLVFVIK